KKPGAAELRQWTAVAIGEKRYDTLKQFPRPDYSMNDEYPKVKRAWTISSEANIISTPAVSADKVMVGNQNGRMACMDMKTGNELWSYQTKGSIYSSPATTSNRVVYGSGDGNIYCHEVSSGELTWKYETGTAILGSPLLHGDTVFIGGSGHAYYALNIKTGKPIWKFEGLNGPVVSKPLLYHGMLIFGAWDRNLYAVNSTNGMPVWTWNNGSAVINYSPASCIPVAHGGVVYVVAPDRFLSAIDASTGETLWRNNDGMVRESIGLSTNGKWIYAKSMQDSIVMYATSREKQNAVKMNAGFGYEHVPSMLVEKNGLVYFGTKNGVVYCIDPQRQSVVWKHKIDNSMVNTVYLADDKTLVVSTMDGKVALLKF
ncbi:MAG TPA: PQQ-binding-like beta-propeller repeat protein, partial [Phnomibacter sp.]|nr:PQQ-binding-like beta-propeller repeat protein [Phnomibacter sp.]